MKLYLEAEIFSDRDNMCRENKRNFSVTLLNISRAVKEIENQ